MMKVKFFQSSKKKMEKPKPAPRSSSGTTTTTAVEVATGSGSKTGAGAVGGPVTPTPSEIDKKKSQTKIVDKDKQTKGSSSSGHQHHRVHRRHHHHHSGSNDDSNTSVASEDANNDSSLSAEEIQTKQRGAGGGRQAAGNPSSSVQILRSPHASRHRIGVTSSEEEATPQQRRPKKKTSNKSPFLLQEGSEEDPLPPPRSTSSSIPDLQRQISRLERDLQRRDRELEDERGESERNLDNIRRLEKHNLELKREVQGLQEEVDASYKPQQRQPVVGSSEEEEEEEARVNKAKASASATSNRQVEELIDDNERLQDENKGLSSNLNLLKESLTEATLQMSSMSDEQLDLKNLLAQAEETIRKVEEDRNILLVKEKELSSFKERQNHYLENLCDAVDVRVEVWKKVMIDKDEEIGRLKEKVGTLMGQVSNTQLDPDSGNIQLFQKRLLEREEQIYLLTSQLGEATETIEANTDLIQKLQDASNQNQENHQGRGSESQVKGLKGTIKKLEERVEKRSKHIHDLELEAEEKSAQLTTTMSRMAQYEQGIYGLPEAVSEIKELRVQLRIRDRNVEGVTQHLNVASLQLNDLQEENEMLRDKLGLGADQELTRESKRYAKNRKNEVAALRLKTLQLEEEIVHLKTRNYSLKKQLYQWDNAAAGPLPLPQQSQHHLGERDGPEGGSVSTPTNRPTLPSSSSAAVGVGTEETPTPAQETLDRTTSMTEMVIKGLTGAGMKPEEWKEKYEVVLEENSALRKGLTEILDCMHKMTEEGSSEVMIQAPVLEELLREMSNRGVINYPFPINTFHLKICNLEGKCSQLREELHRVRGEERDCHQSLFESDEKVKKLLEELEAVKVVEATLRAEIQKWKSEAEEHSAVNSVLQSTIEGLQNEIQDLKTDAYERRNQVALNSVSTSMSQHQQLMATPVLDQQRGQLHLIPVMLSASQSQTHLPLPHGTSSASTFCEIWTTPQHPEEGHNQGMEDAMSSLKAKVAELQRSLKAKDEALKEFRLLRTTQHDEEEGRDDPPPNDPLATRDLIISSLQERLKAKETELAQHRSILALTRDESGASSKRHLEDMGALQNTIHQQQQAFTRMRSTLSNPVRDIGGLHASHEGTVIIKDQMARIQELEDEVGGVQTAMSDTAARLTAALAEAHKWRGEAEARGREVDTVRDQLSQEKIKTQEKAQELSATYSQMREMRASFVDDADGRQSGRSGGNNSARESMTDLVNILRTELEAKNKQLDAYAKSIHNLKNSSTFTDRAAMEQRLRDQEQQITSLTQEVRELNATIRRQDVKISKHRAISLKTGATKELEDLRAKHEALVEEKLALQKELADLDKKRTEEELKKIKSAEKVARWDERKTHTHTIEKLQTRIKDLEAEAEVAKKNIGSLRLTIERQNKERMSLESKLHKQQQQNHQHQHHHGVGVIMGGGGPTPPSASSSSHSVSIADRFAADLSFNQAISAQAAEVLAQGEIARLKLRIVDLQEQHEMVEFEGREEAERLKIEVKLLKDRILSQERTITAYQIAQKGDSKVIKEIEAMSKRESHLQREISRLEGANLDMMIQIEQLKMETPRLRDRVQHLQRLVEALKAEKPILVQSQSLALEENKKSRRDLHELEKTISSLNQIIAKLQTDNRRLVSSVSGTSIGPKQDVACLAKAQQVGSRGGQGHGLGVGFVGTSNKMLKKSVDNLLEGQRDLKEKLEYMEYEHEKLNKKYLESMSKLELSGIYLNNAEKRASSAEMKLKTFLDVGTSPSSIGLPKQGSSSSSTTMQGGSVTTRFNNNRDQPSSSMDPGALVLVIKSLQEKLDRKDKLLATAKQSLHVASSATAPKPTTSPRLNVASTSSSSTTTRFGLDE